MVGGMKTKPSDRRHEVALLRFRVVNYVADRQREGICLAQALREASTRPWPDESGNYFACRTIEDWWYVHAKGGFTALVDVPRSYKRQKLFSSHFWLSYGDDPRPGIDERPLYVELGRL